MAKSLDFSLKDVRVLVTNFGFAKLKLLKISPPLLYLVLCESMQMEGMDIDSCDIVSGDKHLCQVF